MKDDDDKEAEMNRNVRTMAAMGVLGCGVLFFSPVGCAGSIGPVWASQRTTDGSVSLPESTIERLSDCMAKHGKPLGPSYHTYSPVIELDKADLAQKSIRDDIPITAYDFRACTRDALLAMTIPEQRDWKAGSQYIGSPIVVAGVVIVFSELVLEAGAYTIMFAVTVKVVDEAAKDLADVARRYPKADDDEDDNECTNGYVRCIDSGGGTARGNHWNMSRCGSCLEVCRNQKSWPSHIPIAGRGLVPCF